MDTLWHENLPTEIEFKDDVHVKAIFQGEIGGKFQEIKNGIRSHDPKNYQLLPIPLHRTLSG